MIDGLTYSDLIPVANGVRAGIVSYDCRIPGHEDALREYLPRFLGLLGDVHGASFPMQHLNSVINLINSGVIRVDAFVVALDENSPLVFGGFATGVDTFGSEADDNNNLRLFPVKHGEDLVIDPQIKEQFREKTKCDFYPDGIGAGSFCVKLQNIRAMSNPHWTVVDRDNEHYQENAPIIGVMNKNGAVHGTPEDSAVLQLNGLTPEIEKRFDLLLEAEDLPSQDNGLGRCPNNLVTRWASADGKQQIDIIYTNMGSTFDGEPIIWTKIKSNGVLPDEDVLKDVLASLLKAGCREISSPERGWGIPRSVPEENLSRALGGPVPVMHIHLHREGEIQKALLDMGADYRWFGEHTMLSGLMKFHRVADQIAAYGREVPEATEIEPLDPSRNKNKAYFAVVDKIVARANRIFHRKDSRLLEPSL